MRHRSWLWWAPRLLLLVALGFATNLGVAWTGALAAGHIGTGPAWHRGAYIIHDIELVRTPGRSEPILEERCTGLGLVATSAHAGYRQAFLLNAQSRAQVSGHDFSDEMKARAKSASWESPVIRINDGSAQWADGHLPRWIMAARRRNTRNLHIAGAGWPLVSFWSCHDPTSFVVGLDVNRTDGRPLPTRPVWPGLIFNTLFYAALLASLLLVVPLRRCARFKKGRCPRCNYDLAGSTDAGCPECAWNRPR